MHRPSRTLYSSEFGVSPIATRNVLDCGSSYTILTTLLGHLIWPQLQDFRLGKCTAAEEDQPPKVRPYQETRA